MTRLDLLDELPAASLRKVEKTTEAIHKATDSMEYNLSTDPIKVPGQNWACVSFVSPTGNQKSKALGMKIRGIFESQQEATDHVKRLIRLDPTFDIYVCEMYNWCLIPPDPEMVSNQTYQDETLNTLISEYRKNQIYAKEHFEERKRELMEQAADEARAAALKKLEAENTEGTEGTREVIDLTPESTNPSEAGVVVIDLSVPDGSSTPVASSPATSSLESTPFSMSTANQGYVSASEIMNSMI
jgi:excinuclease UvrABC nuclease subunit